MPSLFIVMLGGRHARANTEVHDVVFALGDCLEDCYSQLKQLWFGEAQGLHIDAWAKISTVASQGKHYQVVFKDTPPAQATEKLWLINLGGYDPREFGELHRYVLVTAQNKMVAKQRGKAYYSAQWKYGHTDHILDVDDCLAIECVGYQYIHLIEASEGLNSWQNCYIELH